MLPTIDQYPETPRLMTSTLQTVSSSRSYLSNTKRHQICLPNLYPYAKSTSARNKTDLSLSFATIDHSLFSSRQPASGLVVGAKAYQMQFLRHKKSFSLAERQRKRYRGQFPSEIAISSGTKRYETRQSPFNLPTFFPPRGRIFVYASVACSVLREPPRLLLIH